MKESFVFEYINENEFHKLERSLKKYNMLAYKKLYSYELKLPTDALFSKVHGDIKLHYLVYDKEKIIMLDTLTPEDILTEGHQSELVTYKGVMVSKEHSDKDIFKINLLNIINK